MRLRFRDSFSRAFPAVRGMNPLYSTHKRARLLLRLLELILPRGKSWIGRNTRCVFSLCIDLMRTWPANLTIAFVSSASHSPSYTSIRHFTLVIGEREKSSLAWDEIHFFLCSLRHPRHGSIGKHLHFYWWCKARSVLMISHFSKEKNYSKLL